MFKKSQCPGHLQSLVPGTRDGTGEHLWNTIMMPILWSTILGTGPIFRAADSDSPHGFYSRTQSNSRLWADDNINGVGPFSNATHTTINADFTFQDKPSQASHSLVCESTCIFLSLWEPNSSIRSPGANLSSTSSFVMPKSNRRKRHFASINVRSLQLDGGSFIFGPGGQASIVPDQDTTPPAQQGTGAQAQLQNGQSYSDFSQTIPQIGPSSLPGLIQSAPSPMATTPSSVVTSDSNTITSSPASTAASLVPSPALTTPTLSGNQTTLAPTSTTAASSSPVASVTTGVVPGNISGDTSDLSNHTIPFYIGVVLGTIAIIACIGAFIAWWVRLRAHSKRRRKFAATYVPWCKRDGDDGLEEARDPGFGGGPVSIADIVHGNSWEPTGDRDVGEPKRSHSFLYTPISPLKRPVAPFATDNLYHPGVATVQIPQLADSVVYPLPLANPYAATRPMPHHLDSTNSSIPETANSLGPLQVANIMPGDVSMSRPATVLGMTGSENVSEFGTPRELVPGSRPRFWGLEGSGLDLPWAPLRMQSKNSRRGSTAESGHKSKHPPPSRTPGELRNSLSRNSSDARTEGWTASLRANFVNAINSVAGNLIASGHTDRDNLTPVPQRTGQRRLRHDAGWAEHVGGKLVGRPLKREATVYSTISQLSRVWSLEETGEGVGVVHIHSLGTHGSGDQASSRPVSGYLGTDDGRDHNANGSNLTFTSQTPLIITKKPKAAHLKQDARNRLYLRPAGGLSRASSIYSTASAVSLVTPSEISNSRTSRVGGNTVPLSRRNKTRSQGERRTELNRSSKRGHQNRPANITRVSSSDYSVVSFRSGASRVDGSSKKH
jgi:hypothetical protein